MALEFKIDSNRIKREGKFYLVFALVFVVIAYFFYSTGIRFYTGISKSLKETKDTKTDIQLLESKIGSLKSIKDSGTVDVNLLNVSFQSEDPSLFMYSQLRVISTNNNVELTDISFSQGQPVGVINVAVINLLVKGTKENVFSFITEVGQSAPLSGLGGMSFSNYVESGETLSLHMSLEIYYSPLPEVLPDTNKIVNSLSEEEKTAYDELIKLKVFSNTEIKAQSPNDVENDPFVYGGGVQEGQKE
jgi:hypothetical protein